MFIGVVVFHTVRKLLRKITLLLPPVRLSDDSMRLGGFVSLYQDGQIQRLVFILESYCFGSERKQKLKMTKQLIHSPLGSSWLGLSS